MCELQHMYGYVYDISISENILAHTRDEIVKFILQFGLQETPAVSYFSLDLQNFWTNIFLGFA